jgi:DNA-binding FadR family transcriptional regulator
MSDSQVPFEPAQTKRAFDSILDQVRDRLRSGALRPGQKLPSERDFALQLGVSRNTVREAVRMLEIAGLVSLKKGAAGGAFITADNTEALTQGIVDGLTLSTFTVGELMEARIALDVAIARHAALEATPAEVEELRQLVETARSFDGADKWPDRLRAHLAFEERLAEIAGNPILKLLNRPLLDLTSQLSLRIGPSVAEEIWAQRAGLLEALSTHDVNRAESLVRHYLELLHDSWLGHGAYENFGTPS